MSLRQHSSSFWDAGAQLSKIFASLLHPTFSKVNPQFLRSISMTTVMTWKTSGGSKGRCDAKCHNAKHDKCHCMCGGKYHGANNRPGGVEQAVKDTWDFEIKYVEDQAKAEGIALNTSRLKKMLGLERQADLPIEETAIIH
jgi:hypothetical protein